VLGVRLRVPSGAELVRVVGLAGTVIMVTALDVLGSVNDGKGTTGAESGYDGIYIGNGVNHGAYGVNGA
jgi:hypothetical protein